MCLCLLKFLLLFQSEEYRQDISLEEELLVPLIVLKISREQALIQNKDRESREDFPTKSHKNSSSYAQSHWEIGIFQI